MKLAIMQPYIFPYIGYFQLMNTVDEFVVYDNIEFTKKGWINRNRILVNSKETYLTLPLKKDSDYLQIKERYLADTWQDGRNKILNKIVDSYKKAPCFTDAFPIVENAILFEEYNLFNFIFNSLTLVKKYLDINTSFVISSEIPINHKLRGEQKVLAICKARNADKYYNSMGGIELYKKDAFSAHGIELNFLKTNITPYKQFKNEFVPALSILDIIMFNSKAHVKELLNFYTLK